MSKDLKTLKTLLDKCIDLMNEGESLEDCLVRYPEQAKELEPLLRAIWDIRDIFSTMPRATAKSIMRQRLDTALANSDRRLPERQRRLMPFLGWSKVLVPVAIALVLALIGFGLYGILTPQVVPPVVAQPNFRMLLSDEENAIGDFASCNVTITSIGMLRGGEEGGWEVIPLEPSVVVDLTRLPGLNAQEIWSGNIEPGEYTQVFIYIQDATGTLRNGENGEMVNVILPSGNLQISKPFTIIADDPVVSFVYDVTVVAAGDEYVLLPQVDQSGANQPYHEVGEGQLHLWVVDPPSPTPVIPGENITVIVTLRGENPMPGAQVKVNGVHVGNTSGEDELEGLISFTVPYDDELKIKAEIKTAQGEELEGKLRIDFGDELTIRVVEGTVFPGHEITVQVTFRTLQGSTILIPGATITVNDEELDEKTSAGGLISFIVPPEEELEDEDELEIEAVKDELKGELEIEFGEDELTPEIDLEGEPEIDLEDELTLQVVQVVEGIVTSVDEDEVIPGENITVLVFQGNPDNPVSGATVTVNDEEIGETDVYGLISFIVPPEEELEDEDELEIEAVKDELKGKLEIDLEWD